MIFFKKKGPVEVMVSSLNATCGCGKNKFCLESSALKECQWCCDCGCEMHSKYDSIMHRNCKKINLRDKK